jgi:hypothetical protein
MAFYFIFNSKDYFQLVFHGFLLQLVCFLGLDLYIGMLVSILGFWKTPIACKHKFNPIYKQYKDDKIANEISSNDRDECPFYDALDSWWHQNGNVMKKVNASTK